MSSSEHIGMVCPLTVSWEAAMYLSSILMTNLTAIQIYSTALKQVCLTLTRQD